MMGGNNMLKIPVVQHETMGGIVVYWLGSQTRNEEGTGVALGKFAYHIMTGQIVHMCRCLCLL